MMTRYRPSAGAVLCLLFVLAAVAAEMLVLTPLYDETFVRHRQLKEQLKTVQHQTQNPRAAHEADLYKRLAAPMGEDTSVLAELAGFVRSAGLGDVAYSIGTWQPTVAGGQTYQTKRVELDMQVAGDAPIWAFVQKIAEHSTHFSQLAGLRMAREARDDGKQVLHATAIVVFYHLEGL